MINEKGDKDVWGCVWRGPSRNQRTRTERQIGARCRKESQAGKDPWTAPPVHRREGRREMGAGIPTGLPRAAW